MMWLFAVLGFEGVAVIVLWGLTFWLARYGREPYRSRARRLLHYWNW